MITHVLSTGYTYMYEQAQNHLIRPGLDKLSWKKLTTSIAVDLLSSTPLQCSPLKGGLRSPFSFH